MIRVDMIRIKAVVAVASITSSLRYNKKLLDVFVFVLNIIILQPVNLPPPPNVSFAPPPAAFVAAAPVKRYIFIVSFRVLIAYLVFF